MPPLRALTSALLASFLLEQWIILGPGPLISTFVADIETKAVMEENLLSETAKAEEASALDGENDPWSRWGLSKKSIKKKKGEEEGHVVS